MLIKIIKNNLFLQNLAASIISFFPAIIENNISKYLAIKKAFYLTGLDHTPGSYLEFGVFTGSSFNFAMKINKKLKFLGNSECDFIGFDSFQGFGEIEKNDRHPFFKDEIFKINEKKVLKNINKCAKGQKYRIVKGFFEETLANKTTCDYDIKKARVVLIDCDLKKSTKLALEFLMPSIQSGTIILFDEYICYKGNPNKGECAAFKDFEKKYPNILFKRAFDYGFSGRAFIAYKLNR